MKKLLILLLIPLNLLSQDSWVNFKVQFDFYAASESNFFMVSDASGDTAMFFQPTVSYEYLDTTIAINSGSYLLSLNDTYGDGWVSTNPSWFKMSNDCQLSILDFTPLTMAFFTLDTLVNIWPCAPPAPPGPPSQCVPTTVIINLDQYPSETSWDIKDSTGTTVLSGGPYTNTPNYQPQIINNCLLEGSLTFTIYDVYGDGLGGSLWGGQDGSYYVLQCGDTLVNGNVANFGNDSTHAFTSDTCVPPPPIYGCMDNSFLEFDPLATANDSTYCTTLKIFGCTDTTMFNYDPLANSSDFIDSCLYMLVMNDLVGNGWVGTDLIINELDTFTLASGFTDTQYVWLQSPAAIEVVVEFLPLTSGTATECGWSLTSPSGFVMYDRGFGYVIPFQVLLSFTDCGNSCDPVVIGCMDYLAINYDSLANTNATCYYYPGCTSPAYLEYHTDTTNGYVTDLNVLDSCVTLAVFGCMDAVAFNYNSLANVDNGGCLPVILGCMESLAFNFNALANVPDTCIAVVYGCMSSIALNYDSLANIDDGSCTGIIYGCIDTLAFNYSPTANVDDGSCVAVTYGCINPTQFNYDSIANTNDGTCIPYIYGCTDSTMFNYVQLANTDNNSCVAFTYGCTDPVALNYCDSCNTDDFSCILPIYGCTDSTMFNYNPLANVNNSSCTPFIFGCTDPSMLNYDPLSNTEDFSCIEFLYGCMDSTAINYDSIANTENNSCIALVEGCMDPAAFNYSGLVNSSDSTSCLYSAYCISGDGTPYWLNDPCYAWVIDVDDYCCENEWDEVCQLTYNYCDGTYIGNIPARKANTKKLLAITDLLGRPAKEGNNKLLLYIYDDGTVEKKITKTIN